ncbi:zinc finger BED domain-containing protein 1-like [Acyrthosiphon pisum]|uniref:Uncharacterized protein n=1 Tax=Acyrthosiphon pisum TaxID=7029 RepID=A0A8R2FEA8_ACYPI|nr:zinc finger BED domain-containing protein 1-like [Acyrthosiphon pisum]|eukprot:XP_008190219.1 PREDICTED: zinc finger BED domain-containing protein 1-like [Acyrthosiphon pisum]
MFNMPKKIKTSGNTSNLNGHLKSKHKNALAIIANKDNLDNPEPEASTSNLDNPEPEASTSKIPDVPSTPSTSEKTKDNHVSNEMFMGAFKRQKTIAESFGVMTSFKEGGVKSDKLIHAIIYMICKDNQPISIVEDEGFQYLMKIVSPNFKIPSRRYISRKMYDKYDIMKEIVMTKFKNIQHFTLTTDIWTDIQTRSYIGVTIHFVEEYTLNSALLGVYELDARHTSEYIATKLLEVCKEWNISKQNIIAVVTDGAANMLKAIDLSYGKKCHILCFAHTLNLVAQHAISSVPELTQLISDVKNIVRWFKQSVVASVKTLIKRVEVTTQHNNVRDELRKATKGEGKLLQEVPTRWNSTFYMLERFISLSNIVNDIVHRHITAPPMISAKEIKDISEIIDILRPIEAATKQLCGQKCVTTSMVIPMIYMMTKKINQFEPTQQIGAQLKAGILKNCEYRFCAVEDVALLGMSTILDPRFKKIYFKDPLALSNMLKYISDEIKQNNYVGESSSDDDILDPDVANHSIYGKITNKLYNNLLVAEDSVS